MPGGGQHSRCNMPMTLSPGRETLYAALRTEPYLMSAFAIEPGSGKLTLRQSAPLPAPMAYIETTKDGRLLLSASYTQGVVSVGGIGPDGLVETPELQTLTTPPKAHCILPARNGDAVYATTVEGNAILVFHLNAQTGTLTPADPPAIAGRPGAGPRHLAFHPSLDVLYCVNEHAGSLAAYSVNPHTGALSELQYESLVPEDFQGNALAADVHVTGDGRFVYASVRKTNTISGYRIDPASGRLELIGVFDVEPTPRGFIIPPGDRFLISAGQTAHNVAVYAIDPHSGGLSLLDRVASGRSPSWFEIVPLAATS